MTGVSAPACATHPVGTPRIGRSGPLLLLAASLLHNGEEALTYPAARPQVEEAIGSILSIAFVAPSVAGFRALLAVVSVAAMLAIGWAVLHRGSPLALLLVRGLAWIMLANVAIPHLPAAFLFGGYAPGLATAVLLNLPVAAYVLVATRRTAPKTPYSYPQSL